MTKNPFFDQSIQNNTFLNNDQNNISKTIMCIWSSVWQFLYKTKKNSLNLSVTKQAYLEPRQTPKSSFYISIFTLSIWFFYCDLLLQSENNKTYQILSSGPYYHMQSISKTQNITNLFVNGIPV